MAIKPDVALKRAKKAASEHDWVEATEALDELLQRFPGNRRARAAIDELRSAALAKLLQDAEEYLTTMSLHEAVRCLNAAFILLPDHLEIGLQLSQSQLDLGDFPGVLENCSKLLTSHPNNVQLLVLEARAFLGMGKAEKARESLLRSLEISKNDPVALNELGILENSLGNRPQARKFYQEALKRQPNNLIFHSNLSQAISYRPEDKHFQDLLNLLGKTDLRDPQSAPLFFSLFKAYDDIDDRDRAFKYLNDANRLVAKSKPYNFQRDKIIFALTKVLFDNYEPHEMSEREKLQPIFVTGLPRSGTSLLERVISRNQDTQACGELRVVQRAVARLLRRIMNRDSKYLARDDILELRSDILSALHQYSDGSTFIIDKMPLNYRFIGFICAALPEARVIHIAREPMPVAWSLYKLNFGGEGYEFVYDKDNIARYMLLHSNYLSLWRKAFGDRVIELDYEDLVANTEAVTKDLALSAELSWTDRWLSPERAQSQVLTASASQAHKPIYREANDGWRRYEAQLAPLQKSLKVAGAFQEK